MNQGFNPAMQLQPQILIVPQVQNPDLEQLA